MGVDESFERIRRRFGGNEIDVGRVGRGVKFFKSGGDNVASVDAEELSITHVWC